MQNPIVCEGHKEFRYPSHLHKDIQTLTGVLPVQVIPSASMLGTRG